MGYLAIEELKQGMILSEDVRDINTRLLLSKGQAISPNHLRILKIWGITEVNVLGHAGNRPLEGPDPDALQMETARQDISRVFRKLDMGSEILREIVQACLFHRARNRMTSAGGPVAPAAEDDAEGSKRQNPPPLKSKIETSDIKLPEAPSIIAELNDVIADPLATSNDVARVVNTSPSLASLLLRIVNSAYYGFPSKIDRISRAVTIIGTKEISGLALGISVMQTFRDIPSDVINMTAFVKHSLACGMIARIMAALHNIPATEQLFVSGLLHDIGKLTVYKYFPSHAKQLFRRAAACGNPVYQTETEVLGLQHTQLSKILLHKWNLPKNLEDTIVFHHHPSRASDPLKAAVVHLADIIANGLGIGGSGEISLPGFDQDACSHLSLSPMAIKSVIRQAVHQIGPLEASLN